MGNMEEWGAGAQAGKKEGRRWYFPDTKRNLD